MTSREVVVVEFLSLDGVAEGVERFFTAWDDPEVDAAGDAAIATQDDVILGRRTYDDWAHFWPTSDIEPFASFINAVSKHVATSRRLDTEWAGASRIEGDLVEFVRELKSRDGGDIGVHASISVAQALLRAGVVDRLRLIVAPAIAGSGRRLLDDVPPASLETVRSVVSPSGYLVLDHRVRPTD